MKTMRRGRQVLIGAAVVASIAALGIGPDADPAEAGRRAAAVERSGVVSDTPAAKGEAKDKARKQRVPRKDTKQAQLIAMLRRAKGATIGEIVEALDWQSHPVRGAIAGALKKKLGLNVLSEKSERRGRIYKIIQA